MRINIFILGFGKVGRALARQINAHQSLIHEKTAIDLKIIGFADSKAFIFDQKELSLSTIHSAFEAKENGKSLSSLENARPLSSYQTAVDKLDILVDTTASPDTFPILKNVLQAQKALVLANKVPLCKPWHEAGKFFSYNLIRYEATVGAGLPVISTLKYLINTGDQIKNITGCLSGTLAYLCSQLENGETYSSAILKAKNLGYTEPDPRQDLSGMDVARKSIILARTAGWPIELSDLKIEPLYPKELAGLSIEGFLQQTTSQDKKYQTLVNRAIDKGEVPRYTAHITPTMGKVGLETTDRQSPLGSLQGPDNYISFQTDRYDSSPLILSGPGAGIEVTAAGVLGDIIELAILLAGN